MFLFHLSGHLNYSSMLIPSFSISKNLTQSNRSHNQLTNDQISTSTHWEKQKLLLNLVKLDLGYDSLVGSIVSLFSLLSLQKLRFSNNQFLSQLDTLDFKQQHLRRRDNIFDLETRSPIQKLVPQRFLYLKALGGSLL